MVYDIIMDGYEDYSVVNTVSKRIIAEHIVFKSSAENLIKHIEWGFMTEDDVGYFKPKKSIRYDLNQLPSH